MIDDEVEQFIAALSEGAPKVQTMTGPEARAAIAARRQPTPNPDDVRSTEDVIIPGADGDIRARIYQPHGADDTPAARPLVVFLHGGGFVFCDVESHDAFCRAMARGVDAVVVSVDYRLAPEHPAPAAAEDAYAALVWAAEHASGLGADPARTVVAGDSAGGNLAAVVALMTRDRQGPELAAQALLYPVIDPACDTPSFTTYADGPYNTRAAMEWYWQQYLGTPDRIPTEPVDLVAPARAADHTGLAPAVIAVAGADPLRSEAEQYADRLAAAGVPVIRRTYPGLFHGFMTMLALRAGESARQLLWQDLRVLLDGVRPESA
ncbi:alpha/beta hydrolase [Nocardioides sambongensis]|uniref:alpha/beta hydrolase n=1 Tax=Nocardioides sambongensis TaxID=2589074 RepID=UPI001E595B59|nr:alpha/beta hydrolase [Nocardioides sambongensis]